MFYWKPLEPSDIPAVSAIANQLHKQLPERLEVFEEKMTLFPQGYKKLLMNSTLAGYALAHPWCLDSIPPLDTLLVKLPEYPNNLYIHDVAILSTARGYRAPAAFIAELISLAKQRGISTLSLVSVYRTTEFWARQGFVKISNTEIDEKLKTYGKTACYMVCPIR